MKHKKTTNAFLLMSFFSIANCFAAPGGGFTYKIGEDLCPTVEQLRSGTATSWQISTPEGVLEGAIFTGSALKLADYYKRPYAICSYLQPTGTAITARKDYVDVLIFPTWANWRYSSEGVFYACHASSVQACGWELAGHNEGF